MLLFNRYDYNPHTDLIGKGGSSKVYKVLDKKFNRWLALKMYKATEETDRYSSVLETEKVIALNHPNISSYVDIDAIEKEDSFGETERIQVCVMEIAEGGNIDRYFQASPNLGVLKKLLADVLYGLQYLHENGIIHRDIKPSNILVKKTSEGPIAIIADFGISKQQDPFNNSTSSGLVVSVPYMAPEQLNPQKYGIDEKISANVDIWALGIAVYEIITGDTLFKLHERDTAEQIMNNIVSGELPDKAGQLPPPFAEFVRQCLVKDAKKRVKSPEELIVFLEDEKDRRQTIPGVKQSIDIVKETATSSDTVILPRQVASAVAAEAENGPGEIVDHETGNLGDTQIFVKPATKEDTELSGAELDVISESDTAILPRSVIDEKLVILEAKGEKLTDDLVAPENIDDTRFFTVPPKIPDTDISNINVETEPELDEPVISRNEITEEIIATGSEPEIFEIENEARIEDNSAPESDIAPATDEDFATGEITIADPELEISEIEDNAVIADDSPAEVSVFAATDEDFKTEEMAIDPGPAIAEIEEEAAIANDPVPEPGISFATNQDVEKDDEQLITEEPEPITEEPVIVENAEEKENNENVKQEIFSPAPVENKVIEEIPAPIIGKPLAPIAKTVVEEPAATTVVAKPKEKPIVLFNRYEYYPSTHLIGKGGFSRVYKAFDKKLSRWIALKIYKTGEFSDRYSPIAEIQRVINLDHPNICRYLDIDEIEKENQFGEYEKIQVCVMELLESGNFLEYYKKTKDLDVLKKLLQDVLNGISYLHKNGIIHRDIKPANILIKAGIDGPVAKITDFGISKKSDSENNSSSALVVSIPYMAPEQLNVKKYGVNEKISFNLDLWSLGVTIYEVITGKVLFKNSDQDNSEQIMANIMLPDLPSKINELPQPFRSIVSHCVIKNANERAQKAEELLVLLNTSRHSEGFKETETNEDRPSTAIAPVTKVLDTKVEQETMFVEKKTVSSNEQPVVSDTAKRRKNFLVEDEPVKLETKKLAGKPFPIKIVGGIAAILIIALASVFFFGSNKDKGSNPTESNAISDPNNEPSKPKDDIKPVIPKTDSVLTDNKSVVQEKPAESDAADKKDKKETTKENLTVIPEKKKEQKPKENTEQTRRSETEGSSKKYSVNFGFSESCILKINGIDYGENTGSIKIPLVSGTYTIRAVSTKNTSSVFIKSIVVNAKNSGQRVYISF